MNKYPLIGGSICAVALIVLASLTNVVGYQVAQPPSQKITTKIDEKNLLFQTIVDMVNNKEIRKMILGSEITGTRFFDSDIKISTFAFPEITEKILEHMYTMGVIFSKSISRSKIQSMIKQYQVHNPRMQKALSSVIENDATLTEEMTRLSTLQCDCDNENTITWRFPGICFMLYLLFNFLSILGDYILFFHYPAFIVAILWIIIGLASHFFFNCQWYNPLMEIK